MEVRKSSEEIRPERYLIRLAKINGDWRLAMRRELGMFYFGNATYFREYAKKGFQMEMSHAGLMIIHFQINWGKIWAEVHSK